MHFTSWWWVLLYGHLHGQVSFISLTPPPLAFCYWNFGYFVFHLLELNVKEFGVFCRDIVLDVDGGAAINKDEDQVPGSCFEPGHSVL